MASRILIGTRKGTFIVEKTSGQWRPRLAGHAGAGVNFVARDPYTGRLWALLVPAAAYRLWASYFRALDGAPLVDGTIGVLLGLYICSHPAANGVDLIFLERGAFRRVTSRWSGVRWLALNGVVMFVGWLVIVAGATEVFARGRG